MTDESQLKSVDEFLATVLELAEPLAPFEMPLLDAHGAVLAQDLYVGDRLVLKAGSPIRSAQIGLAASLGLKRLPCIPHPRVVVISIGKDLVEPGSDFANDSKSYEVNSWMLSTIAREAGATTFRVHSEISDSEKIKDLILDQLVRADILVISGDNTVNTQSQISQTLQELGEVQSIELKLTHGGLYQYLVLGPDSTVLLHLPSESFPAFVGGEIFLRPIIKTMMGAKNLLRSSVKAQLAVDINSEKGKREFIPVTLEAGEDGNSRRKIMAKPLLNSETVITDVDSYLLNLAEAQGLLVVPENADQLISGNMVEVLLLDSNR